MKVRGPAGAVAFLPEELAHRVVGDGSRGYTFVVEEPVPAPEPAPEAKPKRKPRKKKGEA